MEEWKDIPRYEGLFQASNTGFIKNKLTGTIYKPYIGSRGYILVILDVYGKRRTLLTHRLIAKTFHADSEFTGATVNHIDGNKQNNKVENLEWLSQSDNQKHAYRTGLQGISEKQKSSTARYCVENYSKKVIQMNKAGEIVATYHSASEAGRVTGYCQTHISSVCRGKVKSCHGFKFKYAS